MRTLLLKGTFLCLLTVFLAAGCSGGLAPLQEGTPDRPNVVLILADDMREDDFEQMPQTRRLFAEEGLAFENAFVTTSLCCPSRASILKGQYAHNHEVLTNAGPEGGFEKFRDQGHENSTVATWLKGEGYQTALIGKYLNGYARRSDETYVPPGWDEWQAELGGHSYYDYRMNENGTVVSYGNDEEDYETDVLAQKARDYVRRTTGGADGSSATSSPFFLYLAPSVPHGPFVPAPRHDDAYPDVRAPRPPSFDEPDVEDKPAWVRDLARLASTGETAAEEKPADAGEETAGSGEEAAAEEISVVTEEAVDEAYKNRLRMLLSLDEMVADLVEELRDAGELENTYVIFTSDNGYHLGEHRISTGKRTAYEEAVRVPLAVRGPGISAGQALEQIVLNIDIAPTIAELVGTSAPEEFVDGRSLVPLLGDAPPAQWRPAFLIEHWSGGRAHTRLAPTYSAVRTNTHKYVEHENGDKELYDLEADPYELENVYENTDPSLLEDLKTKLDSLQACAGRSCREAEDAP